MVLGHRAPDYHGARYKFGHDGARAPGTRVPRARFKKDRARAPGARAPRARAIPARKVGGQLAVIFTVPKSRCDFDCCYG